MDLMEAREGSTVESVTEKRRILRQCFLIAESITVGLPVWLFVIGFLAHGIEVSAAIFIPYVPAFLSLPFFAFVLRKSDRKLALCGLMTFIGIILFSLTVPTLH